MSRDDTLERIQLQILWNRLLAVVEEQAQTLVRTAFSTTVREAAMIAAEEERERAEASGSAPAAARDLQATDRPGTSRENPWDVEAEDEAEDARMLAEIGLGPDGYVVE